MLKLLLVSNSFSLESAEVLPNIIRGVSSFVGDSFSLIWVSVTKIPDGDMCFSSRDEMVLLCFSIPGIKFGGVVRSVAIVTGRLVTAGTVVVVVTSVCVVFVVGLCVFVTVEGVAVG